MSPRTGRWMAVAMLVLLAASRPALESSMGLHMLVQVPLLAACGAVLGSGVSMQARAALDRWNSHGVTGLLAVALAGALVMIPRLLDLAVASVAVDAATGACLVACGVLLRLSWARAGLLVQAFFLGNMLPMTAAIGQAYQDSPLRLCNAYLLDDQVRVGQALVAGAAAVAVAWLAVAAAALARRERAASGAGSPMIEAPSETARCA